MADVNVEMHSEVWVSWACPRCDHSNMHSDDERDWFRAIALDCENCKLKITKTKYNRNVHNGYEFLSWEIHEAPVDGQEEQDAKNE